MKVEYSSNNSGGSWWLKDKDWLALEKAGWAIQWGAPTFCGGDHPFAFPRPAPGTCEKGKCSGHYLSSLKEVVDLKAHWLGASACKASKDFPTLAEAIREWEEITGQKASEEGCNCCGAPHSFKGEGQYVSGEEIIHILFPRAPKSLRAAAERS